MSGMRNRNGKKERDADEGRGATRRKRTHHFRLSFNSFFPSLSLLSVLPSFFPLSFSLSFPLIIVTKSSSQEDYYERDYNNDVFTTANQFSFEQLRADSEAETCDKFCRSAAVSNTTSNDNNDTNLNTI